MDDYGNVLEKRTLTDADVKAIAKELEQIMMKTFYLNLGKGIWGFTWKIFIGFVLWVAASGYMNGWHK